MDAAVQVAAQLLVDGFSDHWPAAWPTLADAQQEMQELLAPGRLARVALDGNTVVGLVGANPTYGGRMWELHPLVVAPARQHQGIGTQLVRDLERQVAARGALTIILGTDDEHDMTTLSQVDLYQHTWEHIRTIRNLRGHPYEFYQRCGFSIVGVVPDANGRGRPDILMARRVGDTGAAQ
jgi:aminoglycoside 6'-N-acetyltransferase I